MPIVHPIAGQWGRQPQQPQIIDPAWGIRPEFAWVGSAPIGDGAGRGPFVRGSSLTDAVSLIGRSIHFTPNTTNAMTRAGGVTAAQTKFTAIAIFRWDAGASNNFPQLLGTSATNAGFRVGASGQGNIGSTVGLQLVKGGVIALDLVTMTDGVAYAMVTSHRQDTGEYYILMRALGDNSIQRAAQTETSASSAGDGNYGVGIARTDFSGSWSGDIAMAVASFDFLPEAQGAILLSNPWLLFRKPAARFIMLPAAVVTPVLSAATVTSITTTGATPRVTITF